MESRLSEQSAQTVRINGDARFLELAPTSVECVANRLDGEPLARCSRSHELDLQAPRKLLLFEQLSHAGSAFLSALQLFVLGSKPSPLELILLLEPLPEHLLPLHARRELKPLENALPI